MKYKKRVKNLFLILLFIVLCVICVDFDEEQKGTFTSLIIYSKNEKEYPYIVIPENRDLKILVLTDTQIDRSEKYAIIGSSNEKTYDFIKDLVNNQKPDLVIITGDLTMVSNHNQWPYLEKYANLFLELNVLWTFCFGNHDCENKYTPSNLFENIYKHQLTKKEVFERLSNYSNCLIPNKDTFNFRIDIFNQNMILVRTLFMFDCEYSSAYEDDSYSRIVSDTQIKWYEEEVNKIKDLNTKSSIFIHVSLPEIFILDNLKQNNYDVKKYYGDLICSDYSYNCLNEGLFECAIKLQNTDSIFFGHHHDNDLSVEYKGIRLTAVQYSGFSHRYRIDLPEGIKGKIIDFTNILKYGDKRGGVGLFIHNNGTYEQKRIIGKEELSNYDKDYLIDYNKNITNLISKGYDVIK